jgi:predicted DNA-binding transcriptional regulator AlpA
MQSDAAVMEQIPDAAVLLTVSDVAGMLRTSTKTVKRWSALGVMPRPRKIRHSVRYAREEIEKWIANGCKKVK